MFLPNGHPPPQPPPPPPAPRHSQPRGTVLDASSTNLREGEPPPNPVDDEASNLLRSVRLKVASRDAEAIRRARWTMIDGPAQRNQDPTPAPPDLNTFPRRASPRIPSEPLPSTAAKAAGAMAGSTVDFSNPALPPPLPSPLHTAATATVNAPGRRSPLPPAMMAWASTPLPPTPAAPATEEAPSPNPNPLPADYVIAVVGHDGVGKSTVIRRAMKTWGGSTPVKKYTKDGHVFRSSFAEIKAGGKLPHDCKVEFVEVNIMALNISGSSASNGSASMWPSEVSPVSGVIICYDATRSETLTGLSETLAALCPEIPTIMLACKSDPDVTLEVEAQVGDEIGQPYNVGLIEVTTATSQGKHKMRTGLRWLLYRLEEKNRRSEEPDAGNTTNPWQKGHHASQSNGSVSSDHHSSSSSLGWMMEGEGATSTEGSAESEPAPAEPEVEVNTSVNGEVHNAAVAAAAAVAAMPSAVLASQASLDRDGLKPETEIFVSLQELLNRLFTAIVSTENDIFVNTFFLVYRRFCQPRELMNEFHDRFVEVEQYAVSRDIRLWALMKLAGALKDWANKYPGDLVDAETQVLFRKTLSCMLKYTFLAHVTVDLVAIEQSLDKAVDLDQSWSCRPNVDEANLQTPETAAALELVVEKDGALFEDELSSIPSADSRTPMKEKPGSTYSRSTNSLTVDLDPLPPRSGADSGSEQSRSIYSDESGHRKWSSAINAVLHMEAHYFALELTLMQWELFAAIRPRDVFRHDFGKERDDPVGRSIDFFNHLSRWVSTMILAHPKPKGRAKVYEAFVKIAHQLRRLNNYDCLCAVISGLRETSIHRLNQTHALVKLEPNLLRDFQSHMKLMDARNGYGHYRRALQADTSYNHTAIPLLTSILGLVNRLQAARPEDRRANGEVQWDKFQRFGDILMAIPTFQQRGSMVPGTASITFRRLIEATPVISSEDGLYERSRLVEPGGSQVSGVLRKLANFSL